jgi:hypothetical protein
MSGLITAVTAVGIGVGAYEASQEHAIQEQALGLAQTQAQKQNTSWDQLQQLMANPASFFQSPVYQSAEQQGGATVARQMAAGGFLGSGNEATALQAYGQTFGQQQLLSQEQLLAGMSGTGFNPTSALNTGSSAEGQTFGQTGTLLAALGQSGAFGSGSGLFGGFSPDNSSFSGSGLSSSDLNSIFPGS